MTGDVYRKGLHSVPFHELIFCKQRFLIWFYCLAHVMRKAAIRVSAPLWPKLGCTNTEDGYMLKVWDLGSRGIDLSILLKKSFASPNFYKFFKYM